MAGAHFGTQTAKRATMLTKRRIRI